jgi:hypothetical protein
MTANLRRSPQITVLVSPSSGNGATTPAARRSTRGCCTSCTTASAGLGPSSRVGFVSVMAGVMLAAGVVQEAIGRAPIRESDGNRVVLQQRRVLGARNGKLDRICATPPAPGVIRTRPALLSGASGWLAGPSAGRGIVVWPQRSSARAAP